MADKKMKDITISFSSAEIMGMDITKSGDYKYASVGIKKGENERMRIAYEWAGEGVPDFVMGLMGYLQANQEEVDAKIEGSKEEYEAFKERV